MSASDLVVTPLGVRFRNRLIPCAIGRAGISADKREGDGATPVGAHRLVGCLYRPDRVARPVDWAAPILPGDLWSDASHDADYNQMVRAPYKESCEAMRRPDPLYDLVLLTDWNWPDAAPGAGSAIFVHVWRKPRHPTEGCVAFAKSDLQWILPRLEPESRLVVKA